MKHNQFKMESLLDIPKIIQPDCWMASVDLKNTFHSIPIFKDHQKYFSFEWLEKIYKFTGILNGYSEAMRVFIEMRKASFSTLRQQGFLSVTFVNDSYLYGATKELCIQNIDATVNLLKSLGFIIHAKKLILEPTQQI